MRFNSTILFLAATLWITNLMAQDTQWAHEVVEFSSELTPQQYSANQVLGEPNVLPNFGESPNAWLPRRPDKVDFIKVSFKKAIPIQQIAIAESFNPTAVQNVYAYDESGKEYLINSFTPRETEVPGRLFNFFFDMTDYKVKAIKVEINGAEVSGYNGIDAIGISNSNIPIKVQIKVTEPWGIGLYAERLSDNVNSEYNEVKPLVSPDGNILYFSRQNHPDNIGGIDDREDIWVSERDKETGDWKKAQNIGAPLNNAGPNFISSITPDGNSLVLGNSYGKGGKMKSGVSITNKTSKGWSKPEALEIEGYRNLSDKVSFHMANNRKVLIMSVDRGDGMGGRDLYVSFSEQEGIWSEPITLGSTVNSASDEFAPFLAADDKTLYFSTSGFPGMGKNDIFVTKRLDETWQNWSQPENLGPEINSPNDDEFFNITADGKYAYYSQGFTENNKDIFKIELEKGFKPDPIILVKGVVFDSKSREPLSARIFYETLPGGKEIGTIDSDPETGEYQIMLPVGYNYGYLAEAEGFVAISANMDLSNVENYDEQYHDLYLVPIEVGQTVTLNNIFFEFAKFGLKSESYPELDRTVEFMNSNPDVKIEVAGHTDSVGPKAYNQTLSELRAKAVYDYLISKGVDASRVTSAGYGEDKPVASNDSEINGRELNRRVEFIIKE